MFWKLFWIWFQNYYIFSKNLGYQQVSSMSFIQIIQVYPMPGYLPMLYLRSGMFIINQPLRPAKRNDRGRCTRKLNYRYDTQLSSLYLITHGRRYWRSSHSCDSSSFLISTWTLNICTQHLNTGKSKSCRKSTSIKFWRKEEKMLICHKSLYDYRECNNKMIKWCNVNLLIWDDIENRAGP